MSAASTPLAARFDAMAEDGVFLFEDPVLPGFEAEIQAAAEGAAPSRRREADDDDEGLDPRFDLAVDRFCRLFDHALISVSILGAALFLMGWLPA